MAGIDSLTFARGRVASDCSDDATLRLLQPSLQQGNIFLIDGTIFELLLQTAQRAVMFGDDDHAGGVLIQAMNDARPAFAAYALDLRAVVHDGIDQSAAGVTGGGVYHHACRFVEREKIVVFIEDVKGDGLSL